MSEKRDDGPIVYGPAKNDANMSMAAQLERVENTARSLSDELRGNADAMTRGEFYAAIRLLEVFAPADPLVTRIQTALGKLCDRVHPGDNTIGREMAEEVERVERMKPGSGTRVVTEAEMVDLFKRPGFRAVMVRALGDSPTPTQPERGQGGADEIATMLRPLPLTIRMAGDCISVEGGPFEGPWNFTNTNEGLRMMVEHALRAERSALRRAEAEREEAEKKLAEAKKFERIHYEDENVMCEALNKLLDEHGGWVEEGTGGTYAGNFRRLIIAAESALASARAEADGMRKRLSEPTKELLVACEQSCKGPAPNDDDLRAILRTAATHPATPPPARGGSESEQTKRLVNAAVSSGMVGYHTIEGSLTSASLEVWTQEKLVELSRRIDALEAAAGGGT